MRILLISANICADPYKVYPLGVSCLHSYIREKHPEWEISLFDFNLQAYADYEKLLQNQAYDYIGVSLRNCDDVNYYVKDSFLDHYVRIFQISRQYSLARLIVGGPCVSIFPEEMLRLFDVDYALAGEGELSICRLIQADSCREDLAAVEGLYYRDGDAIKHNPRHHYLSETRLRFDPQWAKYYFAESGMLNIQTKRGCPYNCMYCSYPVIDGQQVRTLDSRLVVEAVEEAYRGQGANYLFFTDSVFNICDEYNVELAHRLIEKKLNLSWGAYFSPHNFKREQLALFKASGLTHVEFGSDSFSNTQLRNYHKHFTTEDILHASNVCYDLGVFYAHFLILGGWGETNETLDETFAFCQQLKHTLFFPYVGMRIYPHTQLYEIARKEGLISEEEILKPTYYVSKDCDLETLKEKAAQSGQKWIFPDAPKNPLMQRMREKKIKGPLWEYLRY